MHVSRLVMVKQRTDTDCGIACVAMVTDRPYEDALHAVFAGRRKTIFMTHFTDVRRGIQALSHEAGVRQAFESWKQLEGSFGMLRVALKKPHPKYPKSTHWVAFDGRGQDVLVYEPTHGEIHPSHEFHSRPISFLHVYPKRGRR